MSFPWLTVIGVMPLVGAGVVAALPAGNVALLKKVALGVSLVTLAMTIAMATQFAPHGDRFQFNQTATGSRRSASTTRWASTASRSCSS